MQPGSVSRVLDEFTREAHPQLLTESMAALSQLPKNMGDAEAGELVRGSMNCRIPGTGWAFGGCHLGVR